MSQADSPYVDDLTISDASPLWRRIPPWHFVFDQNLGRVRPSTAAFEDHPDGTPMSVVLGDEVLGAAREPQSVLTGHEGFGLVTFPAKVARANGQAIVRKPLDAEPAHAEVFGKKTTAVKKAFVKASEWIVRPPTPAGDG
ncbi:MAG: hypothetical protein FJ276_26295 [Planctomycetes bacterium]|nr:hypothetical protein [Planctomycetota bacterium]